MGVAPRAGGAGVGSTSGTHRPTTWAAAARGDRSTGWLRWDRFGPDPTAGAGPEGLCSTTWAGARSRLFVIALIVFGPERLPKVAADVGRMIRELRKMAIGLTDELKAELRPEIGDLDLASLHPKRCSTRTATSPPRRRARGPARWRDPARSWPSASRRPTTWTRPDNRPAGGVRASSPASPPASGSGSLGSRWSGPRPAARRRLTSV